jgi:PKD domain-containing protein
MTGLRMYRANWFRRAGVALLLSIVAPGIVLRSNPVSAQETGSGAEISGPSATDHGPLGANRDRPPPIHRVPLREGITGSMMVTPPYGNAPLRVGFFVIANDPENIGFLTFQWNFGDGTVSALPPELYIFHTYANPGNYLCSLVIKTVDGRSKTFFQGVIVKPSVSG